MGLRNIWSPGLELELSDQRDYESILLNPIGSERQEV